MAMKSKDFRSDVHVYDERWKDGKWVQVVRVK